MLGMFGYLPLKHVLAIGFLKKKNKKIYKIFVQKYIWSITNCCSEIENTHNDLVVQIKKIVPKVIKIKTLMGTNGISCNDRYFYQLLF